MKILQSLRILGASAVVEGCVDWSALDCCPTRGPLLPLFSPTHGNIGALDGPGNSSSTHAIVESVTEKSLSLLSTPLECSLSSIATGAECRVTEDLLLEILVFFDTSLSHLLILGFTVALPSTLVTDPLDESTKSYGNILLYQQNTTPCYTTRCSSTHAIVESVPEESLSLLSPPLECSLSSIATGAECRVTEDLFLEILVFFDTSLSHLLISGFTVALPSTLETDPLDESTKSYGNISLYQQNTTQCYTSRLLTAQHTENSVIDSMKILQSLRILGASTEVKGCVDWSALDFGPSRGPLLPLFSPTHANFGALVGPGNSDHD
ncbi:unnamed protein product [Rodentolepis nana]|uniref:Uncharacterized protein n=1 Tax=Rodentolepis nana TaxID=102285 RepID=A0A0R3T163_RODNA|nr:unnamed protein product [Rodentolepis nana]